jgi:hypothetical protein
MAAEVAVRQMKNFLKEARKKRYEIEVDIEKNNNYHGLLTAQPQNPYTSSMFLGKLSSLEVGQDFIEPTSFLEIGVQQNTKRESKNSLLKFISRF